MSTKSAHLFRISVEKIDGPADYAGTSAPLAFEVESHDDILAIVDRVRAGMAFTADEASALALGVKLLGGVVLTHRRDPLFADIQPALRGFIGNLKSRVASTASQGQWKESS
ncbi:hypothetical protein B5T_02783 [Alloalcanivorax dieselolei B5]|uniref:DUF3861 domain-containing protein n=1 Tax=Alcanivorax dieselolei (strain DSM 16502 / CGMCC 1.3690 / MCCC 1A00001 / B-5) TaxID=930169 RepID=K0CHE7_ALCDB|nr:DUF3861 domain-containing protein [Alloalcanivorax dieselolei]AFT71051.1 hypothetical protein B5T_02783 [Alloalcanivorax dieselolei B5]GGK00488.1 hypothetical protein GCM10007426_31980 [Alloalcanivorax dieselolei]